MEQLGFLRMDLLPLLILLALSKFITMASGEIFALITVLQATMGLLCCVTSWDTQERPITPHHYHKSEVLHAISMLINDILLIYSTYRFVQDQVWQMVVLLTSRSNGSYFLSRDWASLKWRPLLKEWEQLQDKHSEQMKEMKTLSYSYVKYSSGVPLLLLTVEKVKHENFDFVLHLFLFLLLLLSSSSFPSCITQKAYCNILLISARTQHYRTQ